MSEPLSRQDLLDMAQVLAVRAYFNERPGAMEFYLRSASVQQFIIDQSERWTREAGHGPPVGQSTFQEFPLPPYSYPRSFGGQPRHVETRDPL